MSRLPAAPGPEPPEFLSGENAELESAGRQRTLRVDELVAVWELLQFKHAWHSPV